MDQSQIDNIIFECIASIRSQSDWDSLSETQRTIALVYMMECEVCNGGLSQFFLNPAGNRWQDTLVALRRIGASKITGLFERALALFPHGQPSADQLIRSEQLGASGEYGQRLLNELTDEYCTISENDPAQDSYARMAAYLTESASPSR